MKRFNVSLHRWREWWCEDDFTELSITESPNGEYVKSKDVDKLLAKMKRMQKRIDKLEGRV